MTGVINLLAVFGGVVLAGVAAVFVHDFVQRGMRKRRARLNQ